MRLNIAWMGDPTVVQVVQIEKWSRMREGYLHSVERVLSFFSSRRLREKGWGSPTSDEGTYEYTVVLFIYVCTLWVSVKTHTFPRQPAEAEQLPAFPVC